MIIGIFFWPLLVLFFIFGIWGFLSSCAETYGEKTKVVCAKCRHVMIYNKQAQELTDDPSVMRVKK